jgi:FixJ family two-component response regulator
MPLISIVDDDLSVRRALRRLVRSAGYAVETFASAREFLDSMPSGRTACLILDIHLEGMNGFDLQERMAADPLPIPVIFITAQDDAATRERARLTSASAYVRKPFDEEILLAAIARAVAPDGDGRGGR